MASNNRRRLLAIALVAAFTLMAVSPMFGAAQATLPGHKKTGPYVDKIVYNVITGDDAQVLALLDDDIDLIGDMVDPTFLEDLSASDDVEVVNVLRNGYGYVTINTDKYPMNYTAFRRALAFAMDKEAVSDDVWDGLSVPQDSCVPQVNPFSIEGQLEYTYYEANVALGKQILDDAGFVDTDEDGWIDTGPNGPINTGRASGGEILVECAQSSNIAIEVGALVADALNELGVPAVSQPTDFYEYLNRLYFHGPYDIVFLGSSFTTFDVDWLAYEYWSEYADEPYWNFPNWKNSTYDGYRDALLHSTDYDDVYDAAIAMQEIWVHSSPMIICYENVLLSAYRTDVFEGYVNDVSDGVPGYWTNMKVHRKATEGGPFGGTFRWSNPLDIDNFNFMASSSAYASNVNQMMWDSLMIQDEEGEDVLWLAESYVAETSDDDSAIPAGHTRFTFNMIQNATWSDGERLTAEDVAFSLNYFRDAPGNPYGADLTDMTAAYAPTTFTLVVEFDTESFWHLHTVAYKPVLPKHVFTEIGLEGWNSWNPDPTDPDDADNPYVTSGACSVTEYVAGEFTELTYNPDFFYGIEHITDTDTGPPPADFTMAIVAGAVGAAVVILVGGYVLMRQQ